MTNINFAKRLILLLLMSMSLESIQIDYCSCFKPTNRKRQKCGISKQHKYCGFKRTSEQTKPYGTNTQGWSCSQDGPVFVPFACAPNAYLHEVTSTRSEGCRDLSRDLLFHFKVSWTSADRPTFNSACWNASDMIL